MAMSDETPARDPDGEESRLASLDERLTAAREREQARTQPKTGAEADANYRMGSRVLAELIGGIGGGAFVGWVIDQLAGTTPWGLLVVMALGTFVAFRSIIRNAMRRPD
jgi:ATP synthase protein I